MAERQLTESALQVAVIVGSTREGRFGPTVAQWIAGRIAERPDMTAEIIDLVETPAPHVLPAFGQPLPSGSTELLAGITPRLAAADAFLVVTPEYNHSFPAPLKSVIDWHNAEWHGKPVGFVSYGGLSGGLRAVEQLRVVLAELNATTIRNTVSFHSYGDKFDGQGRPTDPASETAATGMLDQLAWWARALVDAKAVRPYAA